MQVSLLLTSADGESGSNEGYRKHLFRKSWIEDKLAGVDTQISRANDLDAFLDADSFHGGRPAHDWRWVLADLMVGKWDEKPQKAIPMHNQDA